MVSWGPCLAAPVVGRMTDGAPKRRVFVTIAGLTCEALLQMIYAAGLVQTLPALYVVGIAVTLAHACPGVT